MTALSILMLSEKTYPCSHAMLETVYARILPQRGHVVTWVMPLSDQRSIRGWESARWNDTEVYLVQGNSGNDLSRSLRRFWNEFKVVKHIIKVAGIDIVQVRNDWVAGLIGVYMKRKYGVSFVFQVSFLSPERRISEGGSRAVKGRFLRLMRSFLIKEASLVLPISHWMELKFQKEGIPAERMHSFPLGADISIRPEDISGEEVRQRWRLGNDPVVIYFGEMGRIRNLGFLLRVMEKVINEFPDARLLMVGESRSWQGAEDMEHLKSLSAGLGIAQNVVFTGWVPRKDVPKYIASSDVGVSPIATLPIYEISSPTKLVETMAMAKPVVANDIPEQRMILSESNAGICTPYEKNAFAKAILWLLKHPEEAAEMGKRGRRYIEEHRSYEILTTGIEKQYYRLLDRKVESSR